MAKTKLPPLRGDVIRATHQASVTALLGAKAPPVVSHGNQFVHRARWTLRLLVAEMCKWAGDNPGCCPTREVVAQWVHSVNRIQMPSSIHIAATPQRVPVRLAMALIGGAYHEALHGHLSSKRDLRVDEIADLVIPRWAKAPDWSKLTNLLLDWSNICDDIWIERRGNEQFPGIRVKMHDLQDFILGKEAKTRADAVAMGQHEATTRTLIIVASVFRDVGLGYNTDAQRLAMSTYRTLNPKAVKMVLDGPLSPMLREIIDLPADDELGHLRVAMDVVTTLVDLSEDDLSEDDLSEDDQGDEGQSGSPACPKCKAPGRKLKVRPLSNERGGKANGKGVLTCTVCGYQEIVEFQESEDGQDAPQIGDDGGGQDEQDGDSQGSSDPQDGDEDEGQSTGEGSSQDTEDDAEDGDEDGSGKGSDADGDEADGDGDKADGDEADGDEADGDGDGDGKHQDPSGDHIPEDHPGEHEGGGHNDTGEDWKTLADDILDNADEGAGIHDASSALEDSFNEEIKREDDACESDEAPWRPYDASSDSITFVRPNNKGIAQSKAGQLLKSVKRESSYLRARLRNIVLALEQTDVEHGLRRGRGLSQRMLVDSKCSLMARQAPDRAYYDVTEQIDTSLAAAVVIDESGSMNHTRTDATRVMMAITEPLDALGCPVQVSGFRDGSYRNAPHHDNGGIQYHRIHGVHHDVFKAFDERFVNVKYRFACTHATGGTPMADGMKFGLDGLNERDEAHRVLFVITDGRPNYGHMPVIRRFLRLAKDAGIHVVGVGLGYGAEYVKNVFPDYVYTTKLSNMPKALVRKLNQLLDFTGAKRGRRMRKVS